MLASLEPNYRHFVSNAFFGSESLLYPFLWSRWWYNRHHHHHHYYHGSQTQPSIMWHTEAGRRTEGQTDIQKETFSVHAHKPIPAEIHSFEMKLFRFVAYCKWMQLFVWVSVCMYAYVWLTTRCNGDCEEVCKCMCECFKAWKWKHFHLFAQKLDNNRNKIGYRSFSISFSFHFFFNTHHWSIIVSLFSFAWRENKSRSGKSFRTKEADMPIWLRFICQKIIPIRREEIIRKYNDKSIKELALKRLYIGSDALRPIMT